MRPEIKKTTSRQTGIQNGLARYRVAGYVVEFSPWGLVEKTAGVAGIISLKKIIGAINSSIIDKGIIIIPEATQEKSRQRYGEQEMFMNDLNSTTSEQAGRHHDKAVLPVRDPDKQKGKKGK